VVCHDAGGAEVLSSLIHRHRNLCNWHVFGKASSPARAIFFRKELGQFWTDMERIQNLDETMQKLSPDYLFYGTGWQIRVEEEFLHWAKGHRVTSVAFLDHWVNYRERFGYPELNWRANLPDWIVVGDEIALEMARSLGLDNVLYVKNYYFDEIRDQAVCLAAQYRNTICDTCLFVSEPITEGAMKLYGDESYWGFSEIQVIKTLLEHFEAVRSKFGVTKLLIRLHPSETATKYNGLLTDYSDILQIKCAHESNLLNDISASQLVIGFTSMALFIAYLVGKTAISYVPTMKLKCTIPIPKAQQVTCIDELLRSELFASSAVNMDMRFCGGMGLQELLTVLARRKI